MISLYLNNHYTSELGLRLLEHLQLTFAAVGIAAIIGYPLAALVWNRPRWRLLALSFCNLFQTIPSLALLALLLPVLGLGFLPAVVTLTLYAVLPIVRSTLTALADTNEDLLDAGRVLGMSPLQQLWHVRLPAGLPQLVSGLRTAFVLSVGTATLSAFIGAGGLGQFITTGLARNDTTLLLLGAIPAALLALLIDFFLGQIENLSLHWKNGLSTTSIRKRLAWFIGISIVVLIASLSMSIDKVRLQTDKPVIRVGAKNFVEQMILGEILAQKIESTGNYRVERKFNLGSTALIHGAILTGDIDVYVEYSGTAEQNILKLRARSLMDSNYPPLPLLYREKFDLEWLSSLGFSNSYALVVRRDGKAGSCSTISQLAPLASHLKAGLNAEFIDRPDGYPALQRAYGLRFGTVKTLDVGLTYPALDTKAVDAIVAFSTDGRLASNDYTVLTDNKLVFPPYDAAPVLRGATARAHPDLVPLLNHLAGTISASTMRRLNHAVEIDRREPADVAREFLQTLSRQTN